MRNVGLGLLVVVLVGAAVGCSASAKSASSPAAEAAGGASGGRESAMAAAPSSGGDRAPADEAPAAAGPRPGAPAPMSAARAASDARSPATPAAPPPPPPPSAEREEAIATTPAPQSAPIARVAPEPPRAGQLTAGVWDDNKNFDFWRPYQQRFVKAHGGDFAMFSDNELANAQRQNTQGAPHTELDVQLVLDTTGSMGDELAYLQSEFDAIAARVKTKFPNVTPRWSLVLYRDRGDEYLTRPFDFTTSTTTFRNQLRAQSAAGGGDTPEAVVEGLETGLRQSWRSGANVAKIAFWVADAPAHPGDGRALANAFRKASQKGVHLYPIASSDTDDDAEYQMRSGAQFTGGRYVFLTNDSGIGNSHAEPHIPCYNVTRLDSAIVRMIAVELSGRYVEAESNDVVRAVGKPNKEGKCQLASGMLVASY